MYKSDLKENCHLHKIHNLINKRNTFLHFPSFLLCLFITFFHFFQMEKEQISSARNNRQDVFQVSGKRKGYEIVWERRLNGPQKYIKITTRP